MSATDYFIFVNSNVSSASIAFNINKRQKRVLIDNGNNSKNQFFGSETAASNKKELVYSIHFNSRQVVFRYNFIPSSQTNDFDSFYITDEQNTLKLNNFKTRTLANGQSVYYLLIEDKVLVSESYSKKLYFKKDDDFLSYFSIFLPYPTVKNISYDVKNDIFYNDVFVNL